MDDKKFALGKKNFILIGVAFFVVILGFVLMMGPGSTDTVYNPEIFSTRRIVVGPTLSFLGFVFMVYAILKK